MADIYAIGASSDDADEATDGTNSITNGGSSWGTPAGKAPYWGARWTGIVVARAQPVYSAYLRGLFPAGKELQADVDIYAVATDNAATFNTTAFNLSTLARTTAKVTWTEDLAVTRATGQVHDSPNLAPIIQEVVNRAGWASGNAVAIVVVARSSSLLQISNYDGTPGSPPTLVLELAPQRPIRYEPPGRRTPASQPSNRAVLLKSTVLLPKLETLVDRFDQTSLNGATWGETLGGGATTTYASTGAQINLPSSSTAATSASIETPIGRFYDLGGSYGFVEVLTVPNPATAAIAKFALRDWGLNNHPLEWRYQSGLLYASVGGADLGSVSYSATTHKWWRIRESAGTVYWDTSTDGTNWTNRFSSVVSLGQSYYSAQLTAYCLQNETNPGAFKWNDFNAYPKLETLVDPFDQTSYNAALWNEQLLGGITSTYASSGAQFNFPASSTVATDGTLTSDALYDLTGSYGFIETLAMPSFVTNASAAFRLIKTEHIDELAFVYQAGTIYAKYRLGGVWTDLASFGPPSTAWWRIRESGGSIYWDTSDDPGGTGWTNRASIANPFAVTAVYAQIQAWCFQNETNPGAFKWNDFNVASAVVSADAGVASATGAANGPSVSLKPNAGVAAATGAANNAAATLATNGGVGAGTGAANGSAGSVAPNAGLGAATGAANNPSKSLAPTSGVAAASGTANAAGKTVAPNAGAASATGTAYQPGRATTAGLATATGAANNATPGLGASGGAASSTGAANNATTTMSTNGGLGSATGAANGSAGSLKPNAGVAAATGAANNAAATLATNGGVGSAAGAANGSAGSVAPNAGVGAATGTAYNPTVTTTSATNVAAGVASATGAGNNAAASLSTNGGLGSAAGAANGAAGAVAPNAGLGSGTGAGNQPGRGTTAGLATASAAANGATTTLAPKAGVATGAGVAGVAAASLTTHAGAAGAGLGQDKKYLNLPGVRGAYAKTVDSAALSITGDIDLRAQVTMPNWVPGLGVNHYLIGKWGWSAGDDHGYTFAIDPNGLLSFACGDGTNPNGSASASVATGFANYSTHWVRATWRASDNRVQFFTSEDGSSWTQLGTDVTLSPTVTAINNNTRALVVGALRDETQAAFPGTNDTFARGPLRVHRVQVYSGIAGTLALDADFTAQAHLATSFTESSPNAATVTIEGGADIINNPPYGFLNLPGLGTAVTSGSEYASTPDSVPLSITSDIDVRACVTMRDWLIHAGDATILASKWGASNPTAAYIFYLAHDTVNARPTFGIIDQTSTFQSAQCSVDPGFAAKSRHWVRVTWRNSDNRVQFFYSDDSPDVTNPTWTQLGTDQTINATAINDNANGLVIGANDTTGVNANPYADVYRVQLRNNVLDDGSGIVFDAEFWKQQETVTSFAESSANGATVTINGKASIIGATITSITAAAFAARASIAPSAGAGAGAGAANGTSSAAAPTPSPAAATGTANNATITSSSAANAPAGVATATGTANNPAVSLAPRSGVAAATGTAPNAAASLATNGNVGSSSGVANGSAGAVAATAGIAAATGTAYNPTGSGVQNVFPGVATGTGAGNNAASSVATNGGAASGSGAANGSAGNVAPNAGGATASGTANGPSEASAPTIGVAAAVGAAYNPTITTSGVTTAPAGVATGTGAGNNASASLGITGGLAGAAGSANGTSGSVAPHAGTASATATAHDATVTVSIDATGNAGLATATGTAWQATVALAPHVGVGSGTATATATTGAVITTASPGAGLGAAYDADGVGAQVVLAGVAQATGAALGPAFAVEAGLAAATGTAYNAQVFATIGASIGIRLMFRERQHLYYTSREHLSYRPRSNVPVGS